MFFFFRIKTVFKIQFPKFFSENTKNCFQKLFSGTIFKNMNQTSPKVQYFLFSFDFIICSATKLMILNHKTILAPNLSILLETQCPKPKTTTTDLKQKQNITLSN